MFIEESELWYFADDNNTYICGVDLTNILENWNHETKILLKWFWMTSLQVNPGKFQLKILGRKTKFGQINNKFNQNWRK